ncbi:glycoside hydrolase family 2 protein [Psychromonas hadalis]|uniref:glycoside hydrolase family 2 protein n=1 Tax=Psychromonas hadalis TaxID=211669 RepID=UPI0003B7B365|nr:glycoside hydrolase family 2 protein [Psychromonas hadalis]
MTFSLNGLWVVDCLDQTKNINNLAITLPGDMHNALIKAGKMESPYWATNEKQVQWVGECEWLLHRNFELTAKQCDVASLDLCIEYLDTIAEIKINGQRVATSRNMFVALKLNVLPFVNVGSNNIEILLKRADLEAKAEAEKLPFPIPWAVGNNQIPHMNTLRKAQCHSGWDWGICLLVAGVYGDITLTPIQKTRLVAVQTDQSWQGERCELTVSIEFEKLTDDIETVVVNFSGQQLSAQLDPEHKSQPFSFVVEDAKRWWPAGYGEAHLYDLSVELDGQRINKKIGLRELRLITEEDETGSSMLFEVNGFPISAKGANWIPLDAMPGLNSDQRYRQLLTDAHAANMNMIRVWGGGIYEHDIFYELCDELGLLVWQDLMFACALYPSTRDFVENVVEEVDYQVKRLRNHSCIALWCGDNEVIGAIGWYPESRKNREKYVVNYDRLNRALEEAVLNADSSRRFWASSPCNGELDFGDAWHDDNCGDMHYWDVWHSGKSIDAYTTVNPRFCSEFGFQSWPSLPTVKQFAPTEDWNITSPSFEGHQKNGRGNSIITEMFTRYYRFPKSFEQMLYLSQVQQTVAIKTASEYWRAIKPINRGILYWQLNDCWPVSSWSSIEYDGRWKQLHYQTARFFAPLLAVFVKSEQTLCLQVVSDKRECCDVSGELIWQSWSGELLHQETINATIEADANVKVWSWPMDKLTGREDEGFFYVKLANDEVSFDNTHFTAKAKQCRFIDPELRIDVLQDELGIKVEIKAKNPAFFVHLEYEGKGRFTDSSFTLLAGETRCIGYIGNASLEELKVGLTVYDLYHSYA